MRKSLSSTIWVFILASAFTSFSYFSPACAQQRTWTVDPLGQADFSTIQEAINAAIDGDLILVRKGIYCENVVVNKTVSVIGEDSGATIINGSGIGHVVVVASDDVNITGFTVQNSGAAYHITGINLNNVNHCNVSGNIITNNEHGLEIHNSSYCNTISGNNISENAKWGMHIISSHNNSVSGNIIGGSLWGSIAIHGLSTYNQIFDNSIGNNDNVGINIDDSNNNSIYGNNITSNMWGVSVQYAAKQNIISRNNIANNSYGIKLESNTYGNTFYHNNLVNNTFQVSIVGYNYANTWDDGYPCGGNYWNDYDSTDLFCGFYQNDTGSDRIADEPYIIDADNIDNFPLMNPWHSHVLSTDINDDGMVNILDINIVTKAFGSKPTGPNWNAMADLDKNGLVNIVDVAFVAKDQGRTFAGDTVTDFDGNIYRTIRIGNQTWMMENLRTTRLNDGQPITYAPASSDWASLRAPGYCWPNNNSINKEGYGCLYNWYAVGTGKLAPIGWHVPTDEEWKMLIDYLGGEKVAGGKLKEMSFTVRYAGVRTYDGVFGYFNEMEKYWTSTEGGWHPADVWYYTITKFDSQLSRSSHQKMDGHSVRCVKDASVPP